MVCGVIKIKINKIPLATVIIKSSKQVKGPLRKISDSEVRGGVIKREVRTRKTERIFQPELVF